MTTGYNIREGAQILSDRFATDSAEVQTAASPLPKDGAPWSELTAHAALPSAEDSFSSDFFLACLIWVALLLIVGWVYLSAQWIGLL